MLLNGTPKKALSSLALVPSIMLLTVSAMTPSTANPGQPRLVVFILGGTDYQAWLQFNPPKHLRMLSDDPLRYLASHGAMGLMNAKGGDPVSPILAESTIGMGDYTDPGERIEQHQTDLGALMRRHGIAVSRFASDSSPRVTQSPIFGPVRMTGTLHSEGIIEIYLSKVWSRDGYAMSNIPESIAWASHWNWAWPELIEWAQQIDINQSSVMWIASYPKNIGQELAPILLAGRGFRSGIVNSASTRWPGIVCNVDLAPTILRMFNIPLSEAREAGMIGTPIEATAVPRITQDDPLGYIERLDRWTASMHASVPRIYTLFGIIEGLLVLITIGACAVTRQRIRNVHLAGRVLLTTTLLLPLTMIPVGLWKFTSSGVGGESEIYLSLALAAACAVTTLFCRQAIAFWVTAGTLTLAVDLVLHFSRFSPFAFSLVSGSRFYGMGNEHMALLVACLVLWVGIGSGGSTRTDRLSKGVLCAITAVMLGNSSFGANFGGALTAVAALGTAWVAMSSPRWTWRQTLFVVLLVVAAAGVTALDFTRAAPAQSHIGRTFGMSLQRVDPLLDTIKQKLAMNWKFMLATPVSLLEIVLLAFLAKCIYRPYPSMKKLFDSRPRLHRTLYGAPVGMLVGFLANDSGIVVLVLMLVVYVPALLGLLIELEMERTMSVPSGSLVAEPSCKENAR